MDILEDAANVAADVEVADGQSGSHFIGFPGFVDPKNDKRRLPASTMKGPTAKLHAELHPEARRLVEENGYLYVPGDGK